MKEKNGKCQPAVDCCYDVDLLASLSVLLQNISIQDQVLSISQFESNIKIVMCYSVHAHVLFSFIKVMNSHALSNGLMMDYCDGDLFKKNP